MIYKIYRNDNVGYDEYHGIVVCASNEDEAFAIAKDCTWGNITRENSDIEIISCEKSGLILASFNAG